MQVLCNFFKNQYLVIFKKQILYMLSVYLSTPFCGETADLYGFLSLISSYLLLGYRNIYVLIVYSVCDPEVHGRSFW